MISWSRFKNSPIQEKVNAVFQEGTFIVDIRYYGYKVNLYQLGNDYVEVFINHKQGCIEKIELLNHQHSRMKFYCDQIRLSF